MSLQQSRLVSAFRHTTNEPTITRLVLPAIAQTSLCLHSLAMAFASSHAKRMDTDED